MSSSNPNKGLDFWSEQASESVHYDLNSFGRMDTKFPVVLKVIRKAYLKPWLRLTPDIPSLKQFYFKIKKLYYDMFVYLSETFIDCKCK